MLRRVAERERAFWQLALGRWRGSVLPVVLPRVMLCALFGAGVALAFEWGLPISLPVLGSVVPSIVLGLLLVFRTNTAYERFWEGRKLWGGILNCSRNLARRIWVSVLEETPADREAKVRCLHLLVAFAVALKQHLRGEQLHPIAGLQISAKHWQDFAQGAHPPMAIALRVADYLQQCYQRGQLNPYQLTAMMNLLDELVALVGGCERILKTPIPLAYSVHLKQLLMLYCLALPFQVVDYLHGWTSLVVGLISFAVFGIEEIGIEIENPFGVDPNDLPLDAICQTLQFNIDDLMRWPPQEQNPLDAAPVETTAGYAPVAPPWVAQ